MKIAVIAANGRSGRAFVERALARGHIIKAGVHNAASFAERANLSIVTCDATNLRDVEGLISGCNAVVSFIGHVKDSPSNVQSDAMRVVTEAMRKKKIKRIVSLTGTGVRFPHDAITFMDRLLNFVILHIDPERVNDGKAHVAVLQKSDLDWTVLRVLKLQDGSTMPFVLTESGPTKLFVSRRDVADAALQVLEQGIFIHKAPILSKVAR